MNTCFLVYRLNSQSLTESRELVNIFSTSEKANEFIDVLEKFISSNVSYEYEEWKIE